MKKFQHGGTVPERPFLQINEKLLNNIFLKRFLGMDLSKKFRVCQKVFCTTYGHGEVLATDPETPDDSYPVQVVFNKDQSGERVEFYDQEGKMLDHDQVTLFSNKPEAMLYIQRRKEHKSFQRVFNCYDDGKLTEHTDEISAIAGTTYEECHTSRKLVRRHRIVWSN